MRPQCMPNGEVTVTNASKSDAEYLLGIIEKGFSGAIYCTPEIEDEIKHVLKRKHELSSSEHFKMKRLIKDVLRLITTNESITCTKIRN